MVSVICASRCRENVLPVPRGSLGFFSWSRSWSVLVALFNIHDAVSCSFIVPLYFNHFHITSLLKYYISIIPWKWLVVPAIHLVVDAAASPPTYPVHTKLSFSSARRSLNRSLFSYLGFITNLWAELLMHDISLVCLSRSPLVALASALPYEEISRKKRLFRNALVHFSHLCFSAQL